jgi:hypothetical protein
MGSTRRFKDKRSHSTPQSLGGEGARILDFDPERRTSRAKAPLPPKRPERPAAKVSIFRRMLQSIVGLLVGPRGRRPRSRGAERSGKRRA